MVSRRLKQIVTINIFALCIFLLIFIVFLLSQLWNIKIFTIALLVTIPYLAFSILSYFKTQFFPVLPFLLNILLAILLSMGSDKVRLYVFLLAPVILAMYYGSKKLNKIIVAFNILCFFGYIMFRGYVHQYPMPKFIINPIISTLPYSFELFSVIWLSKRFIIDAEQVKKQNEIYTTMSFKNSSMTIDSFKSFFTSKSLVLSQHADNVFLYTSIIIDELSKNQEYANILTPKYKRFIENGAFLHDLGRLSFDNAIAEKFSNYTEDEMEFVKIIPAKSVYLLSALPEGLLSIEEKEVVTNIMMQSHEFFDGSGYPKQLTKRQISFEAQIVCVADYLDSKLLVTDKDEKSGVSFNDVYMEMITKGYDKFNQDIVNAVYERRGEIIDYAAKKNNFLKENK